MALCPFEEPARPIEVSGAWELEATAVCPSLKRGESSS